jgi:hypothetical protein
LYLFLHPKISEPGKEKKEEHEQGLTEKKEGRRGEGNKTRERGPEMRQ